MQLAALNHTSNRLVTLLQSLQSDLPATLHPLLPAALAPCFSVFDAPELNHMKTVAQNAFTLFQSQLDESQRKRWGNAERGGLASMSSSSTKTIHGTIFAQSVDAERTLPTNWRIHVCLSAMLRAGEARDLSHTITLGHTVGLLDLNKSLFVELIQASENTAAAADALLSALSDAYHHTPHHCILIHEFLARSIISPLDVIRWMAHFDSPLSLKPKNLARTLEPMSLLVDCLRLLPTHSMTNTPESFVEACVLLFHHIGAAPMSMGDDASERQKATSSVLRLVTSILTTLSDEYGRTLLDADTTTRICSQVVGDSTPSEVSSALGLLESHVAGSVL